MNMHHCFSGWLDQQLEQAGMSGKELANRIGVSEATISRIRNGRTPLSPRLKNRLSAALNTAPKDIPITNRISEAKRLNLSIFQSPAPDHAILKYAAQRGLFLSHNVHAHEIPDFDLAALDETEYNDSLQELMLRRKSLIVVGPEPIKEGFGLKPIASIFSHMQTGYHVVTRACTNVSSIVDIPPNKRLFSLKLLLEHLDHAAIWANNFDRFAWHSSAEFKFVKALGRLSYEMTGGNISEEAKYCQKSSNNYGLQSLHDFGRQGADFAIITNATLLADAYSNPQQYKVLLNLKHLMKTVNLLNADAPPALLKHLMTVYRADRVSVAIERFKSHWSHKLSQLETPIYWNIYCSEKYQPENQKLLIDAVSQVRADALQELATPHLRENMLHQIKEYCDARTHRARGILDTHSFNLAWDECYSGL